MTNPVARVHIQKAQFPDGESKDAYKEVIVWCPGCEHRHAFTVELYNNFERTPGKPPPVWVWDGRLDIPTFSPSLMCYSSVHLCNHVLEPCLDHEICNHQSHKILNYYTELDEDKWAYAHVLGECEQPTWGNCHSFLRNGIWEFLADSAHKLAGQKVAMEPLPDKLMVDAF